MIGGRQCCLDDFFVLCVYGRERERELSGGGGGGGGGIKL